MSCRPSAGSARRGRSSPRSRCSSATRIPRVTKRRHAMAGNLCRCGAYDNYLNGVMARRRAHGRQAHMTYKLLGKNFTPPDVLAKVTGQAKYAEDFRVDGMVFCRFLPSPYPARARQEHRRVRSAEDGRRARHSDGRRCDAAARAERRRSSPTSRTTSASPCSRSPRSMRPRSRTRSRRSRSIGAAAVHDRSAHEPAPRPGGCAPGRQHRRARREVRTLRWTKEDFDNAKDGTLPMGKPAQEWS